MQPLYLVVGVMLLSGCCGLFDNGGNNAAGDGYDAFGNHTSEGCSENYYHCIYDGCGSMGAGQASCVAQCNAAYNCSAK